MDTASGGQYGCTSRMCEEGWYFLSFLICGFVIFFVYLRRSSHRAASAVVVSVVCASIVFASILCIGTCFFCLLILKVGKELRRIELN